MTTGIACSTNRRAIPVGEIPQARPVTATEEAYGHQVLAGLSREFDLDYADPRLDRVTKIIDRLTKAAKVDLSPWHVYLFRAPQVKNAGVTRGNHVFVWSGLLDFIENDEELAVILSHELAHVLSGHTDPDPDQELKKMLINLGAMAAGLAVSVAATPHIGIDLGGIASGATEQLGAGVLTNPYSKELEREADQVGLFLLAEAGYNPEAAISFWKRVQNHPDFSGGSQFFSTHPAATDRLATLEKLLPLAQERLKGMPTGANAGSSSSQLGDYYQQKYGAGAGDGAGQQPSDNPAPGGDSFDWTPYQGSSSSRTAPAPAPAPAITTSPSPQIGQPARRSSWRVQSWKALLHEQPAESSKALGEFRQGASLSGVVVDYKWLLIDTPDRGYLPLRDLESLEGKRRGR